MYNIVREGERNVIDIQIIGQSIIEEMRQLIEEDVIVTDTNGFIIASTNKSRINQFHEGAFHAMKTLSPYYVEQDSVQIVRGVKEGVGFPIIIDRTPIGVIGISGNLEQIKKYGKLVSRVTELYVEDFLERREKEWKTYSFEFFLMDFLNERLEPSMLKKRMEELQIEPDLYTRIIVIDVRKHIELNNLQHLKNLQLIHPELRIARWGVEKLILLVPNVTRTHLEESLHLFHQKLEKLLKTSIYIGVGNAQSFHALPISYRQANVALQVCFKEQSIVFEEDLKIDILLSNTTKEQRETFLNRTLAPILNDGELLDNLDVWLRSLEPLQDIANKLHIHKNTLKYRLKKIEKLLNVDLHRTSDRTVLYIALYLYKQQKHRAV